jgi:hypothetical protein
VANPSGQTLDAYERPALRHWKGTEIPIPPTVKISAETSRDGSANCFYPFGLRNMKCPVGQISNKSEKSDILSPLIRGGYKAGINNSERFE